MFALDTNVLVRLLVDDPSDTAQCEQARRAVGGQTAVWIAQVVLIETIWVLEKRFGFAKNDLLLVLRHLCENPHYKLQNRESMIAAVADFAVGVADFEDYLILNESRSAGHNLLTFDKKLLKSPDTQRLAPLRK